MNDEQRLVVDVPGALKGLDMMEHGLALMWQERGSMSEEQRGRVLDAMDGVDALRSLLIDPTI